MKRFLILFLLPVMGYAGAVMRAFERFDPFYDYSETFYYGNIQTSFNRPLAGIGLRYKDEELGFDAGIAGAYAAKDVDGIIQAEASVLYFPFTDYVYLGMGAGEYVVKGRLHRLHFEGPGKRFIDSGVISEFNEFVFFNRTPFKKGQFQIVIQGSDSLSSPSLGEGYQLEVNDNGIKIVAESYVGAVWGLMTLQQLIRKKKNRYVIENTPLKIVDAPSIAYRSLMLDTGRQFLPVSVIKKQIRAMAFNKLNVFHWHITDGQSFPLKIGPRTRRISRGNYQGNTGAFSRKEVYSKRDVREIVEYAKARGIAVIPEFDAPGHAASWVCGYPEMMVCTGPEFQSEQCCPEPPCGFLNIKDQLPAIQKNVSHIWEEVIRVFRVGEEGYSRYIHIGFDEVGCVNFQSGTCNPPSCNNAFGPYSEQYANWFFNWIAQAHPEIQTVLWVDQILSSNFKNGSYQEVIKMDPDRVIFEFWLVDSITVTQLSELASKGFRLINSQSTTYYLDAGGQGNNFVFGGPLMMKDNQGKTNTFYQKHWMTTYPGFPPNAQPASGWAISWEEIYLNNPFFLSRSSDEKIPMMGVSVSLWGEQIDQTNLDQQLWPKAAAFAESVWRFNENRPPDNIANARYRLIFTREDILRLGVFASPMCPADVFRNAPWGTRNSTTPLMYDINQEAQQVPVGYTFNYMRYWLRAYCQNPLNPYCGSTQSSTMNCDNTGAPYIQGCCPGEGQSAE